MFKKKKEEALEFGLYIYIIYLLFIRVVYFKKFELFNPFLCLFSFFFQYDWNVYICSITFYSTYIILQKNTVE